MVIPVFLAPFIAPIIASIGWALKVAVPALTSSVVGWFLFRVLLLVVYFVATTAAVTWLLAQAATYMAGIPADVIQLLTLSGVINAMNIIASAYLFKLTLKIDAVNLLGSKAS